MRVEGKEKRVQGEEIRKNEGTFLPKVSKLGDSRRSEATLYPVGRGVSRASLTMAIIRPNTAIQKSSHTDEGLGSGCKDARVTMPTAMGQVEIRTSSGAGDCLGWWKSYHHGLRKLTHHK